MDTNKPQPHRLSTPESDASPRPRRIPAWQLTFKTTPGHRARSKRWREAQPEYIAFARERWERQHPGWRKEHAKQWSKTYWQNHRKEILAKRRRKRVMGPHWWEGLPGDGHGGLVHPQQQLEARDKVEYEAAMVRYRARADREDAGRQMRGLNSLEPPAPPRPRNLGPGKIYRIRHF